MDSATRGWLTAATVGVAVLVAPGSALGATLGVLPTKPCYRAAARPNGEKLFVTGSGFTSNGTIQVRLGHSWQGSALADSQGAFAGLLALPSTRGERRRLLVASDEQRPGISASLGLHMTGVDVAVAPRRAVPGRAVRVTAHGFTASRRLYAHVRRRGRRRRDLRVGKLKGACHGLSARTHIFSRSTRPGVYHVQFDGERRYSRQTKPRIRYRVTIFPRRPGAASAAADSWVRRP